MKYFDNVFTNDEHKMILEMCSQSKYTYGTGDKPGFKPTGSVCRLDQKDEIPTLIINRLSEIDPELKTHIIKKIYINCFAPSENPYFHQDSLSPSAVTALYYPHDFYDENEGGETQILASDDLIVGIKPRPNRVLIFKSNLVHRATAFRTKHRFTIAIKYESEVPQVKCHCFFMRV
jgi:hypothetical protein